MPHFPANPLNLWELACQRWGICLTVLNRVDPIREQARSHRDRIHAALSGQPTGPVGAGLPAMAASASPSKTASTPFASKLAPTGIASMPHFPANPLNLWELACQRWRPLPHRPKPGRSHSRASSLPQGSHPCRTFLPTHWTCGSWLATDGGICLTVLNRVDPIREQARSHRDRLHPALSCQPTEPVGAGLPTMAASASPSKTASIPFASKLAPTGIASMPHFPANPLNLWELACQRWRPLPHRPKPRRSHSRASSLPQGPHLCRTFRPTHMDRLHPALPAKQLNLWERACSRRRQLLHHPATAQAVSVLARWSPEVIPTGPRYCRRRRSRGTGSHPVSRCCPRHSGSSS
ncbi:hypothetical protein PS876_04148 [Pseudomonas fluorescens]|nr:hypothetical protein PS876_04148 [Pseudomonas fluorescens]